MREFVENKNWNLAGREENGGVFQILRIFPFFFFFYFLLFFSFVYFFLYLKFFRDF